MSTVIALLMTKVTMRALTAIDNIT